MMRQVILALAATAILLTAACGKKGELLPPPGYEEPAGRGGQ